VRVMLIKSFFSVPEGAILDDAEFLPDPTTDVSICRGNWEDKRTCRVVGVALLQHT
jgi:hypothetical protein